MIVWLVRVLTAVALVVITALSIVFWSISSAAEGPAVDNDRIANSQLLSNLTERLAEQYPNLRALVLARSNCLFFEYYNKNTSVETQSHVYSVTKSVLSILIGIARDQGYLHLDEKLSNVFPEEFDENVDPLAREITVRDLLTKTEGFAEAGEGDFKMSPPVAGKRNLWRWMLNRRVKYSRGTRFRYDGIGSDLLSVVLSRKIRQSAADFAKQKLFDPLHIDNYTWYVDSEEHLHGEFGLYLTARDMAKVGILYLQHGRWGSSQIVSDEYVRDSTSKHNDGGPPIDTAYGYQWWIGKTNTNLDAFFAAGYKGQLIYVDPAQNLVIAVSAESIPGGSRKLVANVILPAVAQLSGPVSCAAQYGQD